MSEVFNELLIDELRDHMKLSEKLISIQVKPDKTELDLAEQACLEKQLTVVKRRLHVLEGGD